MITKETTIETLEVTADNLVILRERVAIVEDGTEIGYSYVQRNFAPGDDYSGESDRVRGICAAVATAQKPVARVDATYKKSTTAK